MKKIGLEIKAKNQFDNYLYKIFDGIELSNYQFVIDFQEIWYSDEHQDDNFADSYESLFNKPLLNGEEFYQQISKDKYFMITADINVFKNEAKIEKIESLEDYFKSDCEMTLFCFDCTNIEFYCKDKEVLDKVYKNCMENEFEEVQYLSA